MSLTRSCGDVTQLEAGGLRRLLQLAGPGLEEHATRRILSAITGLTEDVTAAALDELEWNRWLMADARGYAFVAGIVREVVARDMLTEGQRQRIEEDRKRLDPSR